MLKEKNPISVCQLNSYYRQRRKEMREGGEREVGKMGAVLASASPQSLRALPLSSKSFQKENILMKYDIGK